MKSIIKPILFHIFFCSTFYIQNSTDTIASIEFCTKDEATHEIIPSPTKKKPNHKKSFLDENNEITIEQAGFGIRKIIGIYIPKACINPPTHGDISFCTKFDQELYETLSKNLQSLSKDNPMYLKVTQSPKSDHPHLLFALYKTNQARF